jgi:cytidylate kinase
MAVLSKISAWTTHREDNYPVCWLYGPAGSGKSTIAHTIASQCAYRQVLALSFFFSGGRLERNDTTRFFPTFAYRLASFFPTIQPSMQHALERDQGEHVYDSISIMKKKRNSERRRRGVRRKVRDFIRRRRIRSVYIMDRVMS